MKRYTPPPPSITHVHTTIVAIATPHPHPPPLTWVVTKHLFSIRGQELPTHPPPTSPHPPHSKYPHHVMCRQRDHQQIVHQTEGALPFDVYSLCWETRWLQSVLFGCQICSCRDWQLCQLLHSYSLPMPHPCT